MNHIPNQITAMQSDIKERLFEDWQNLFIEITYHSCFEMQYEGIYRSKSSGGFACMTPTRALQLPLDPSYSKTESLRQKQWTN